MVAGRFPWSLLVLFLFSLSVKVSAHPGDPKNYPKDYFRAPVEGEVRLSGTFGELRSNHFHSGIDIKGYRGRKIVSVANGYIYRINVQAGGYGNSLYIKHPNGYISLYAHLNNFTPEIADFVAKWQQTNKEFELNYYPDSTEFVVKKGQELGAMGNTGYSFGPHLHFEIRKADGDLPVNPLHFGIPVADTRAPIMNELRIYGLDESTLTTSTKTYRLLGGGQSYRINEDTIRMPAERAGIAIKTYDVMDGVTNWNGVYKIQMLVDGQPKYTFVADEFSFDEWTYVHAHYDYADMVEHDSYFNRCYRLPGNHFSGYQVGEQDGILPLNSNKAQRVSIISTDWKGNESKISFWIKKSTGPPAVRKREFQYYLPSGQENQINNYYLYLKFPAKAFFEDVEMNYHFEQAEEPNLFSTIHSIHDPLTPIFGSFTIAIRPTLIPEHLREKAFIARCSENNRITNCGGDWDGEMLKTQIGSFGDYAVMIDTVPPTITAQDFQYNLRGRSVINFKARDDIGISGTAKGLRYRATIDGRWVLLTYDLKYSHFSHRFANTLPAGEHTFRMEVTDDRGNTAVFEEKFLR